MMGFQLHDIIKRIRDEKNISEEEIDNRIKQKLDKLSGLISKEGAAHIVANELGVDLISSMKKHGIKIAQVMPGMRNVTIVGAVMKHYGIRTYQKEGREGKIGSFLVGDESGAMRVVVWDTDILARMEQENLSEGNMVRASDGFVKENNGYREMHLGSRSALEINPPGIQAIRVREHAKPSAALKTIASLHEGDFARVRGTIIHVFEPRFYEGCSECGKKLDQGCKEHGAVQAVLLPVINFSLDDGTGIIPAVAFRDAATRVLGVLPEHLQQFHHEPGSFERTKQDYLGRQLTIDGKIQHNALFDRIELVAQSVDETDPEQLAREFSDTSFSAQPL